MKLFRPKGYSGGNSVSMRPDKVVEVCPFERGFRLLLVNGQPRIAMSVGGGPLGNLGRWEPEASTPLAEEAQRRIPFPRPKAPHGGCD